MLLADYKASWNSKAILDPAARFRVKLLKEAGSYTRTIAKNSMIDMQVGRDPAKLKRRDRKLAKLGLAAGQDKVSRPGSPAFSKVGFLKQFIYFAADENEVVIGPALLAGVKSKGAVAALELGGQEQLLIGKKTRISVTATYQARPTMQLAFQKMIDRKLAKLIAGGIMREA